MPIIHVFFFWISKIFFSFENSPPGDLVLGLGVLLEEGVGEAALEVTQEPFRFQNQPSLRRENGIIIKLESESDLFEEGKWNHF